MDYNEIRKIIQDMGDSKLDTLEIEFPDGLKIKMEKDSQNKEIKIKNIKQHRGVMTAASVWLCGRCFAHFFSEKN